MRTGTLADYLEDFLTLKRAVAEADPHYGRKHRNQLNHNERHLRSFVSYWQKNGCPWPIRAQFALDWLGKDSDGHHPYRDVRRVRLMRAFLRQVRAFEPETEVLGNVLRIVGRRHVPYIFSSQEILRLMAAARQDPRRHTLRPLTLYTLIGLLASTGLRIGEAIRLKLEDVRWAADPPALLITETKFAKSRQVILHPSTADQLRAYAVAREKAFGGRAGDSFFVNLFGLPLDYDSLFPTFRRLLRRASIRPLPGARMPCFHSFRHSFVVSRLTQWHREGKIVQDLMTHLAVYLGHIGPEYSYWYLTATPELLDAAAARFTPPGAEGGLQ